MINKKILTNKTRNKLIIALCIFIILLIAGLIMIKYDVQGEKNLPFKLSKIMIVSSAKEETVKNENEEWVMKILQNNDLYFYIESDDNKDKLVIDKVIFDNFNMNYNYNGQVGIYKPNNDETITYKYTDEYKTETIEYTGAQATNRKFLEINNQGGMAEFSIAITDLGEYLISKEQTFSTDGLMLNLIGTDYEDIKFTATFDMTISIENGNTYKANITLDLPVDDITQDGVCTFEDTELSNIVFKRI